jgi:hypothetical protein
MIEHLQIGQHEQKNVSVIKTFCDKSLSVTRSWDWFFFAFSAFLLK